MAMSEQAKNFRKGINRNFLKEKMEDYLDRVERTDTANEHRGKNMMSKITSEELREELEL